MNPTAPATLARGNSSRMIPNDKGSTAPPTPWMTRATIRTMIEWDSPASTDPAASAARVSDQQPLLAHHVADASEDRRENRRRQQVRGQHPRDGVLGGVELVLDGRERRDHQGLEEGVRHRADHQDGEGQL